MEIAVIMAGGVGTRLYPASSAHRPKQFLSFDENGESLLSRTVTRAVEEYECDSVYVSTRAEHTEQVKEHAPDATVLAEPEAKDTGPALVYAAHRIRELEAADPVLLCLPSDHLVSGLGPFAKRAMEVARVTERLVTLGITPTRAATEYGYITPGVDRGEFYDVEGFYEKPDAGAARRYIENGYYWNAGVFAWTPHALLSAARETELAPLVRKLDAGENDQRKSISEEEPFASVDPVSIDYAVLEKTGTDRLALVPADVPWDDLGSWDAFRRVCDADEDGNVTVGNALTIDTEDCVIATDGDTHVSAVGVEDLTIAAYDGNVLVVPTDNAQRVREVVEHLHDG